MEHPVETDRPTSISQSTCTYTYTATAVYKRTAVYSRETARQLRIYAQLTRCFSAVAELLVSLVEQEICDA